MANSQKKQLRKKDIDDGHVNDDGQGPDFADTEPNGEGDGQRQKRAKSDDTSDGVQFATDEAPVRRKPRRLANRMVATGYANHAFEKFDPNYSGVQLSEFFEYHDKDLAKYGRF